MVPLEEFYVDWSHQTTIQLGRMSFTFRVMILCDTSLESDYGRIIRHDQFSDIKEISVITKNRRPVIIAP